MMIFKDRFKLTFYALIFLVILSFSVTLNGSYDNLTFFMPIFQLVILYFIVSGIVFFTASFKKYNVFSKYFMLGQIFVWSVLLILYHPGFVNADTFGMQLGLSQKMLSPWITIFFSAIVNAFYLLDPTLFLLSIFYVFIYISCLKKCLDIGQFKSSGAAFLLFVMSFFPLIQLTVFYLSRDTLFGLLTSYVILCVAEKYFKRQDFSNVFLAEMALLVLVLSEMRQDAKFFLIAFPLFLWMLVDERGTKKKIIALTLGLLSVSALVNAALITKHILTVSRQYQLTGLIHPLNYIVYKAHDQLTEDEKSSIGSVIDLESLKSQYSPTVIQQFHDHKYSTQVSQESWDNFISTYQGLVLKNRILFLTERVDTFLISMNLKPGAFVYSNEFDADNELSQRARNNLKLSRWNVWPWFSFHYNSFVNKSINLNFSFPVLGFIFASPLFFLVVSVAQAYRLPKLRYFYFASSVFFASRFPIVFLMAPEPQMKYYAPLIYLPLFVCIIAYNYRSPNEKSGESYLDGT